METKQLSLEWKADEQGVIEGYGSVFDVADLGNDIVAQGAFTRSLQSGRKVKMLYEHDPRQPIGVWDDISEDGKGLRVKGRLLMSLPEGKRAYELIKEGAVDGLSIGYRTVKSMDRNGKRVIMQADLWEVSLVNFPMNEQSQIDAVKAMEAFEEFAAGNATLLKRALEDYLRDAGFSNAEAKAGAAATANKIGAMREAGTGLDEVTRLLKARAAF